MQSVSILIPCYQERNFIRSCLDSVREFEVPDGVSVEVLVLDGMSTDGTRDIVTEIAGADPRIRLVDNPKRTQSAALNLAIPIATGDYIMRLDAHSFYPKDYLAHCVETAIRTGADNTGGVVATLQRGAGYQSALVQALTTHMFGVGDSGFRTDAAEGSADTVPYGFFRKDIFARVGFFDERLLRAQDYEMNRRIIAAGGKIWMNPTIRVQYYQQPDMKSFIRKQFVHEAPYNAYMWYLAPYSFTARHAITGLFSFGVIAGLILSAFFPLIRTVFFGTMALYFVLALASSIQQALRYREPRHVIFAPFGFFAYHFLHGLGILIGLARLATGTAPVQGKPEPWPGAGRFRAWPVPSQTQVR